MRERISNTGGGEVATIVVANTKGGVGKTTTAVMLATALSRTHSVELLDADPQGSASEWISRASEAGEDVPFSFTVANARTLARPSQAQIVVIDTPPGHAPTVEAALRVADFIIIPTTPTGLDVDRMWQTLDATEGQRRAVLLTRAATSTRTLRAAMEVLDAEEVPRFETIIHRREAIVAAFGHIPTDLHGYESVAAELMEELA